MLLSRFLCLSSVSCAKSSVAARQLQLLLPWAVSVLHKRMTNGLWQQRQLLEAVRVSSSRANVCCRGEGRGRIIE